MSDPIHAFLPIVWRHLLETTVVVFAVIASMPLLRRQRARLRHAVWFAASVKFLVPFALLVAAGNAVEWAGRPVIEIPMSGTGSGLIPAPTFTGATAAGSVPIGIAFSMWLAGFLAVVAIWLRAWLRARRAIRAAKPLSGAFLPAGKIPVRGSSSVSSPGVYGLFRPVLLVPAGLQRRLTLEELRAVVAHEFAHVRRRDNLTTAFHSVVTAVFWFHPFVWWIGRQLVNERERAADEAALREGHAPDTFAEGLLKICRSAVGTSPACVAGISSSNLNQRMEGIMRHSETIKRGPVAAFVIGAMFLLVVLAPVSLGLTIPATVVVRTAPQSPEEPEATEDAEPEAAIWVEQDAQYIITPQERAAFEALETDEERERFIEQFWLRRDPTPGTAGNEMRDEHDRRIASANERFAYDGVPGWQTDRGAMYIRYGEPDYVTTSGTLSAPLYNVESGGRVALSLVYPFEHWRYRYIEGLGQEVVFEFVDRDESGEYRLAESPWEKFAVEVPER